MHTLINRYKYLINSIIILGFITLISHLFREKLDIINIALIHIIPVVIVSIYGEAISTILITILSVILFNFLYIPPLYSFTVHNELYIWSFIIFGIVGWIITYQAKKLNRQKRQNELRESLLHIISHDLRTPLSTIHGSINLILDNKNLSTEKISMLLEDINHASLRMKRLITNLFDSARLSNKEIDLELEWCDFEDIIGVALEEFPLKHADENLALIVGNTQLYWGDNILLTQLIVNLFDNAFKYAKDQTKIHFSIYEENDSIWIKIFNKNETVDETKIKSIFDKFYRIEDSNDTVGSGIGLAICKSIVMLHHGNITAEAKDDGIEIQIILPILKKANVL